MSKKTYFQYQKDLNLPIYLSVDLTFFENSFADFMEKMKFHKLTDKEEDFIDRAVSPRINSRLGCQCVLEGGSGFIEVTLPDQTQFLGE